MNTNGTMITRERAEAIVQAGTYLLTFSIDGCDAETNDYIRGRGTFEKILRGIRNLREARQSLSGHTRMICSHVLMRSNLHKVVGMVDLCTEIGLQNLIVTNLRRMGAAIQAYKRLGLTEEQKMWAAERLAERFARGNCCNVQIETVSLLGKVLLNEKYGLSLPVLRGGCDAVTSKAYVQPDGALFPCQDVANEIGKLAEKRSAIQAQGVDSWESERYQAIGMTARSLSVCDSYVPCRTCPALGSLCTPCPLPGLRGKTMRHDSCLSAMRKAEHEGVSLDKGVAQAVRQSGPDQLVQDPVLRREFLTSDDIRSVMREAMADETERTRLGSFRDSTLSEFQSLLRAAAESIQA